MLFFEDSGSLFEKDYLYNVESDNAPFDIQFAASNSLPDILVAHTQELLIHSFFPKKIFFKQQYLIYKFCISQYYIVCFCSEVSAIKH
jgi:hypothetical protein